MAILCPFLLKEYENEVLRRKIFSDIYIIMYMFKVEVYTCMLLKMVVLEKM